MSEQLSASVAQFCRHLREEYEFAIGPREVQEAMRAVERVGVERRSRFAAALRAVCASRAEEIEAFDRAFAAFFSTAPAGVAQPSHAHPRAARAQRKVQRRGPSAVNDGERPESQTPSRPSDERLDQVWQMRRARYSPESGEAQVPTVPSEGLESALAEAQRLITRLRMVRSLRWRPQPRGKRFDLRGTLRASLRTGGDAILPRMLGRPLRDPRFVLLLDGSRSMAPNGARMLQFAYALCRRTRRATVFLFSTKLRDVTRQLREAHGSGPRRLDDLGEAWGGGTRIGASLTECLRKHGARLGERTFVIVMSDGLDTGNLPQFRRAMGELARRSAAIAWVNPHAAQPGYAPAENAMSAALPYLATLTSFDELRALTRMKRRTRVAIHA
jgi:uncharacterized protein